MLFVTFIEICSQLLLHVEFQRCCKIACGTKVNKKATNEEIRNEWIGCLPGCSNVGGGRKHLGLFSLTAYGGRRTLRRIPKLHDSVI